MLDARRDPMTWAFDVDTEERPQARRVYMYGGSSRSRTGRPVWLRDLWAWDSTVRHEPTVYCLLCYL